MKAYYYFSLSLLLIHFASYTLPIKNNPPVRIKNAATEIQFKGEKKPILGLINAVLLRGKEGEQEPFSVTHLIQCEDNGFIHTGDILNTSPSDVQEIGDGNAVYCPFYTLAKTRLSRGSYKNVGAIILGTKDIQKCSDLHFASMQAMVNKTKNETQNTNK